MTRSVVLIGLNAMLALVAAVIFSKPWMQWFALGVAAIEIVAIAVLIIVTRP